MQRADDDDLGYHATPGHARKAVKKKPFQSLSRRRKKTSGPQGPQSNTRGILNLGRRWGRKEHFPTSLRNCAHSPSDHYYRLDLLSISISQKLRNMLKRADRELSVKKNTEFHEEHKQMIAEFIKNHRRRGVRLTSFAMLIFLIAGIRSRSPLQVYAAKSLF